MPRVGPGPHNRGRHGGDVGSGDTGNRLNGGDFGWDRGGRRRSGNGTRFGLDPSPPGVLQPVGIEAVDGFQRIVDRVPIQIPPNQNNRHYLKTKKDKLGHLLDEME